MVPTSPDSDYQQVAATLGPAQWNKKTGALMCDSPGSDTTVSSGETALATTSDAAVEAIAASATDVYHNIRIINEGAAAGFYSIDGGVTWSRLPATSTILNSGVKITNKAVQVKRVTSGSNLSGVFVEAW